MIEESVMLQLVLEKTAALPPASLPLEKALHHFAAQDIFTRFDSPLFDNSLYDGYAVADSGRTEGMRLRVEGEQPAGRDLGLLVGDGTCIRIFTGASLPQNTSAIVMQEDALREGDTILLREKVEPGFGIRRQGADICKGQKILSHGQRITPAMIGMLASQGLAEIPTGTKPRISILCTGNEIRAAGQDLRPGEIYESNGAMLSALFRENAINTPDFTFVPDSPEKLRSEIHEKSKNCDVLLVSGGMSVGDYDFAPDALKAEGFTIEAHRVRLKPGKPFLFGTRGDCLAFGFPGNPVATFLTALIFARPAILRLAGAADASLPASLARMGITVKNPGDRPHYLRGRLENGIFTPIGLQQSHALFSLSQANALLRLSENGVFEAGETVSLLLLP